MDSLEMYEILNRTCESQYNIRLEEVLSCGKFVVDRSYVAHWRDMQSAEQRDAVYESIDADLVQAIVAIYQIWMKVEDIADRLEPISPGRIKTAMDAELTALLYLPLRYELPKPPLVFGDLIIDHDTRPEDKSLHAYSFTFTRIASLSYLHPGMLS